MTKEERERRGMRVEKGVDGREQEYSMGVEGTIATTLHAHKHTQFNPDPDLTNLMDPESY